MHHVVEAILYALTLIRKIHCIINVARNSRTRILVTVVNFYALVVSEIDSSSYINSTLNKTGVIKLKPPYYAENYIVYVSHLECFVPYSNQLSHILLFGCRSMLQESRQVSVS